MRGRCAGKLHDSVDDSLPPRKLYVLLGCLETGAYAHQARDVPSFSHFRRKDKPSRLTCVENLPNILIVTMSRAEGFLMISSIPCRDISCNERKVTQWSRLTKNRRRNYCMGFLMNRVTTLFFGIESVRRRAQI